MLVSRSEIAASDFAKIGRILFPCILRKRQGILRERPKLCRLLPREPRLCQLWLIHGRVKNKLWYYPLSIAVSWIVSDLSVVPVQLYSLYHLDIITLIHIIVLMLICMNIGF